MYEDHLKSCEYCQKGSSKTKPTISIKKGSSYRKQRKLSELGAIIRGASYPPISIPVFRTKGASESGVARKPGPIERAIKLKELGKLVRG